MSNYIKNMLKAKNPNDVIYVKVKDPNNFKKKKTKTKDDTSFDNSLKVTSSRALKSERINKTEIYNIF